MLVSTQKFSFTTLALCLCMAGITSVSSAAEGRNTQLKQQNAEEVEHIEVISHQHRQAFPTRTEMKAELKTVAGGTNLVELDLLPARQATLQDALGFEAGVVMQSFFGGNDQPRLNIRGSGVQSNPVNRGVQLLYDGLPINAADGSFVIGFLDPKSAEMVSVHRGANGLRYGATTLGGAINLISRNGTSSASNVRGEYGSDSRMGATLQLGGQDQALDYFTSLSHDRYDGYRHHSQSERTNFSGNLGYTFAKHIYNRTYLNYSDNYFDIPFVVPKAIALKDQKQILGDGQTPLDTLLNVYKRDPHRDSQLLRVANKTRISQDETLHEIGLYYQLVEDTFTDPLKHNVSDSHDYGVEYAYITGGSFISSHDDLLVALSLSQTDMDRDYFANNPQTGQPMQRFASQRLSANNAVLALQWQAMLSEHMQLSLAGQWVKSNRDIDDNTAAGMNQDKSYQNVNPKLGINYLPSDNIRLFANVSKTAEAPTFWELVSSTVSPRNPAKAKVLLNNLQEQTSTTVEVGSSGNLDDLSWDVSLYRTNVDDELISIVSDFAVNGKTDNYAAGTIHQGVEVEFKAELAKNMFSRTTDLATKIVYNYSDFYFDGGQYKGNQIAGIPQHVVQAELSFTTHFGLYIAPNILWQPKETAVDHANSQFQDDYLLLGLKLSYQIDQNMRLYLDAQNLTNEKYQTSYVIRGFSKASQPTFLSGFGPSFSVGIQINL